MSVGGNILMVAGAEAEEVAELIVAAAEPGSRSRALEAPHGAVSAFDAAVVLLQPVVQVAAGPVPHSAAQPGPDRPRVAGYTRDGRPYEMQAKSAEQDLRTPQVMELNTVQTKMQMRDGATMVITANAGTYDSKAEIVSLRKNVVGLSSDGTEFRLNEMTFDVRKGHMVSQQPVEVVQPRVRINANSMEVIENGGVVRFQGGVRFVADEAANHAGKQASQ